MSMSGDPVLERMRAIEDDFADAMSRMYTVGNELATLRARLETEASPAQWTPVAEPAAPPTPAAATAAPQPSPVPTAPAGLVTPPPPAHAPAYAPAAVPPPARPQPPAEPWWQRDGVVAKILAVVGATITLIGVAFLLALAIQMGFFGPVARVTSGALLAMGLVGAAALVRRREAGTVGALGLAATGIATAYLDVLAVTRIYDWVPLAGGMVIAGLIALGGVLLARAWDSQLLAVVAVLGVALMAPFVGLDHGRLTGAFLLVLTIATWPAQVGRRWWALELARVVPTGLFLAALALAQERTAVPVVLALGLAVLVVGTTVAGTRSERLPLQLGALVPVGVMPVWSAGVAAPDRWVGTALLVVATCLLLLAAGLVVHREGTAPQHRVPEIALAAAGVTSLTAAPRAVDGGSLAIVAIVGVALVWAVAALVLRQRSVLLVAWGLGVIALLGSLALLPYVVLRSQAGDVGPRHLVTAVLLVALLVVTARASERIIPATAPVLSRALLALAVVSTGGAVVVSGVLLGQLLDDPRGGFTAGQAGATVVWMAAAALLLLRGLRGSTIAVPAGLTLAAASVVKLLLFDLAFLGGLARVVSFIVAGLLLLGMGAGYAQALERSRREATDRTPLGPPPGPVDNPAAPTPIPPTV